MLSQSISRTCSFCHFSELKCVSDASESERERESEGVKTIVGRVHNLNFMFTEELAAQKGICKLHVMWPLSSCSHSLLLSPCRPGRPRRPRRRRLAGVVKVPKFFIVINILILNLSN